MSRKLRHRIRRHPTRSATTVGEGPELRLTARRVVNEQKAYARVDFGGDSFGHGAEERVGILCRVTHGIDLHQETELAIGEPFGSR